MDVLSDSSDSDSSSVEEDIVVPLEPGEDDGPMEPIKGKNEIEPTIPDIVKTVTIEESDVLVSIGSIESLVDSVVVIKNQNSSTLIDIDSIITFSDKTVLGAVEDVFGPVSQSFYSVRISSSDATLKEKASIGTEMFAVERLLKIARPERSKGSDASNIFDEEIADSDQEFSDDEKEQEHKRQKKAARNPKPKVTPDKPPQPPVYPQQFVPDPQIERMNQMIMQQQYLQMFYPQNQMVSYPPQFMPYQQPPYPQFPLPQYPPQPVYPPQPAFPPQPFQPGPQPFFFQQPPPPAPPQ
ncbi:putative H/ACA ribonucleoprotein complex non-core subunit NAF1 [Blattamonas nauphoetae]|uniref:H/ACA ribonucleoprotein complex subunit n=1 Tax=Blattamonas nauphoetae TaxID=2049346 RepID=A0ABQ9X537_9EUKA|nr:putative H/ACA ribonucleoprotein complex non-core subunit NAF1 [Blattamonas nauphoetae]